ncbi:MAG: dienelactone hydrolase family protein [Alphaproteobacteria bacterium]
MAGKEITITGPDGAFAAYLAAPQTNRGPGIVVIQEIFGVNEVVRNVCNAHAAQGRFALAPDLFWRLEPGVQLTDRTDAEWRRAVELMNRFDVDKGVNDIQAAISHLRGVPGCSGKIGAVGYCLGGLLAFLTAARTDANASVGYYGVSIHEKLGEAKNIRNPLLLHIAVRDEFVPPQAQRKIMDALEGHKHVTIYTYPEMGHAFARPGGKHYDRANAELANGRTATFFRQHLG